MYVMSNDESFPKIKVCYIKQAQGRTHQHKQLKQFKSKRSASDPVIQAKNNCCFRFEYNMNRNLRHIEIVIVSSANLIRPTFRLHKSWKVYINHDTYAASKLGFVPLSRIHDVMTHSHFFPFNSIIDYDFNYWFYELMNYKDVLPRSYPSTSNEIFISVSYK